MQADDRLIPQRALPLRDQILPKHFESFAGVGTVMLPGTVNAHQFLPDSTLHRPYAEALVDIISQMDHADLALSQQAPQHTLHPEQTTGGNALH
jgi:cytosine/adenosine deaminase-related metal-dependent hydrolase